MNTNKLQYQLQNNFIFLLCHTSIFSEFFLFCRICLNLLHLGTENQSILTGQFINNINHRLRPKPRIIIEMQFTVNSTSRISKKMSTRFRETQPCFNLGLVLSEHAQIVQISTYY